MKVVLNGKPSAVADNLTVADLMTEVTGTTRGSAAVVDGEVLPRSEWATYRLAEGQVIELITAVQGG